MTFTKDEIIKMINLDEPDYPAIAKKFRKKDIPVINELAKDQDLSIASKAIIILGLLNSEQTFEGIEHAVNSENPILKISAANALKIKSRKKPSLISRFVSLFYPNDESERISNLMENLISDRDKGVAKYAIKAIDPDSEISKKYITSLKNLNTHENNTQIKKLANDLIQKLDKYA